MKLNMRFATRVNKILSEEGISAEEFATMLELNTKYVRELLTGNRVVTKEIVKKTAEVLNVSVEELVKSDQKPGTDIEIVHLYGQFDSRQGRRAIDEMKFLINNYMGLLERKEKLSKDE
ncbi:helix-turn-helix domain-containing protein [Vagococcus zengguangii]|uniref:Helix-turn-helix transcriptional regulator n=1 Tax=Vagococcus zengguangii TaxID=2571750 RepID=A0A4D7CTD8_9ENTE|nr:helix-turn-helix transcriptional regulator [Vagococcus zengguangii]QCI86334.1 helix-turn-helix transcriptional regulator [Vagococcus zengguangii]